ncbi:hypothetical protein BDW66DRAFT_21391 [Aspergillus desertorum]
MDLLSLGATHGCLLWRGVFDRDTLRRLPKSIDTTLAGTYSSQTWLKIRSNSGVSLESGSYLAPRSVRTGSAALMHNGRSRSEFTRGRKAVACVHAHQRLIQSSPICLGQGGYC